MRRARPAAPNPTVPDEAGNVYVFEKPVPLPHGTTGRIDLYRRGSFVLEAKQGSDNSSRPRPSPQRASGSASSAVAHSRAAPSAWDTAMERAKQQAQMYARNLPPGEIGDGRPPFLVVVDVGQSIALYAEFTRSGGNYLPFPDPQSYRIGLADLTDEDTRELLRTVWLDPMSLIRPPQRGWVSAATSPTGWRGWRGRWKATTTRRPSRTF
ncbi:MAG: hypothetical protein M9927_07460 [Anaerolineae bacterium]|nr:hypothetical protein [Anaerolineae bacterium]